MTGFQLPRNYTWTGYSVIFNDLELARVRVVEQALQSLWRQGWSSPNSRASSQQIGHSSASPAVAAPLSNTAA